MAPVLPAPAAPAAPARAASVLVVDGLASSSIRVQGHLEVRADILPDSVREEPDGSLLLRLRIASSYPVRRFGWFDGGFEEFEEVLSFEAGAHRDERLASGRMSLLRDHETYTIDSVLGVVFAPEWDRAQGFVDASCRVSPRDELAGLRKDLRARIVTNTSAGYRVYQYRDVTKKGDPRRRLLAIDWEIREVSLVAVGADPTSSTRGEPGGRADGTAPATLWTLPPDQERTMDPELEPTTQPAATATTATQEPAPAAARAATAAPATPAVPVPTGAAGEAASERERQRVIRSRLTQARVELGSPLAVRLLDGGATVSQASEAILDELTRRDAAAPATNPTNPATRVELGTEEVERTVRAVDDVLTHRTLRSILPEAERVQLEARMQGNPFAHRRLLQIGEAYLARVHGIRGLERLNPLQLATEVLHRRRADEQRSSPGYHVTSDFASVLANVANKGLQRQYSLTPDTYQEWTVPGTLPDFKSSRRVNLGDAPRLVRKPEGGEVTFGAVSDRGEVVQLLTYARGITFSREAIINDDLNAFMRFPRAFGAASRQLIADLVYSVLTANAALADGFALFDATNHGNLVTGVGNSLSANGVAALSNVRALGRRQTGIPPGNNETPFFLNVDLVHLRVPEALETAAQQLVSMIQAQQVGNVNPFMGAFRSVKAEPRLGADSQTAFYLMADPAMYDTIEVDFLEGEQGPVIESRMSWMSEGVEMKCRLDVGVAATEHRGLYKNEGTT